MHELARRLTGDFEVRVICPHTVGTATREVVDGVEVIRFRYAPASIETLVNDGGMVANVRNSPWKSLLLPGYALGMIFAILRESTRRRPDVVHAHWIIPQGLLYLAAGLVRSSPLMVTSHGADLFALRGPMFASLRRFVASKARLLTVVSPAMKERLISEGVAADKIFVAPMGVDFHERFTPGAPEIRSSNELLFVGRLVEKKGLSVLIQAMPEILLACPAATLTVGGFGPEEADLRKLCESLGLSGQVTFMGAVKQVDLPRYYRRAALFIAPFVEAASGDQEGLGLVALEAAGCGCPVIISDMPATREVFDTRVTPGSPPALAAAVIAQLAATREARAELAGSQRQRLVSSYDWSSASQVYSNLLSSILDGGQVHE